ncbi:MAG: mandelate racemase/muconate lactonizing enzyme family protein [Bryobacteraceae bacterium]|nr:mandelate racemase/muconate lactonizing enzyme family protein [Bryobacteraceae bacterium]
MKISRVRPLVMGTPWRNLTFVVVETDEGLTGVGEARMINHTDALIGYLAEAVPNHVLGQDPFNREKIVKAMYMNDFGRGGEVVMSGIAVIEMACWDIVGKALNQPVYRLMGGAVRDRIPAYANGWYTVERTPEEFARAARRVVERGYRAAKLDPFGAGFYELEREEFLRSISLVEAVRAEVGPDFDILIEMHGRFSPAEAIRIARELEPFRPGWLEEPVPPENLRALKKVAEAVHQPIATGERIHSRYEYRELFELQACDIVQADLSHFGGLSELRKLAAWAECYYMLMAPHNVGGPVLTAACLHVDACTPNFKTQEHFNDFADAWIKGAVEEYPEVVDGSFRLPDKPGLGVTLREDFIAEHPRQEVRFNLFEDDWHLRQQAKSG